MTFGIEIAKADRPCRQLEDVEEELKAVPWTDDWEFGVREVARAPAGKAFRVQDLDGTFHDTDQLWQPFLRTKYLAFDIIFEFPMTQEMALAALMRHANSMGARPFSTVKGGEA